MNSSSSTSYHRKLPNRNAKTRYAPSNVTSLGRNLKSRGLSLCKSYEGIRTLASRQFYHWLACRIILESAYSLHDRVFFDNLFTVLLYAVIVSNISYFYNFRLEH